MALKAMGDGPVDGLHGINPVIMEKGPDLLPQIAFRTRLFPGRLKKPAAHLLNLVKQKGQHHQYGKNRREILLAEPVIMAEVVALILEGIEGLVFDLPAGPAGTHDGNGVFPGNGQIGHPTEPGDLVTLADLPVFQKIDQQVRAGLIEGNLVEKAEIMNFFRFIRVRVFELRHFVLFLRQIDLLEEILVVTGLGAQNKAQIKALEVLYVRGVAAQAIFHHNDLEMGMLPAELLIKTAGRVTLAVVFNRSVLFRDHFRENRNYYQETDSLYIDLSEKTSVESKEISEGVVLDYDAAGNLVGIDIDNASKKVQLKDLFLSRLPSDIHTVAA